MVSFLLEGGEAARNTLLISKKKHNLKRKRIHLTWYPLSVTSNGVLLNVIIIHDAYRLDSTRSNPSSNGSKISTNSHEEREVIWCNGSLRFRISAIVTALLQARPIAFSMIRSAPFPYGSTESHVIIVFMFAHFNIALRMCYSRKGSWNKLCNFSVFLAGLFALRLGGLDLEPFFSLLLTCTSPWCRRSFPTPSCSVVCVLSLNVIFLLNRIREKSLLMGHLIQRN